MHGKKRAEYKAKMRDPKIAAGLAHKAQQWHALNAELSQRRKVGSIADSSTTMALLEKALLVNPDPHTLWNYRRELLVNINEAIAGGSDEANTAETGALDSAAENKKEIKDEKPKSGKLSAKKPQLAQELALTQSALQRNPKAYGAWFHRKWIVQKQVQTSQSEETSTFFSFSESEGLDTVLRMEMALTAKLLQLDERNFHCWNYRRFVVGALASSIVGSAQVDGSWDEWYRHCLPVDNPVGPQIGVSAHETENGTCSPADKEALLNLLLDEWKFTKEKIGENFSNFSAFHYRGQLLPAMVATTAESKTKQEWAEEELELMENAMCTEPDDQTAWWYQAFLLDWICQAGISSSLCERLSEQAEMLRELKDESSGKWVRLGLHRLLCYLEEEGGEEERSKLLEELISIDPDRKERYRGQLASE